MREQHRSLTLRQKRWIVGTGIVLFLVLSVLACWFAGRPLIQFAQEPERFRSWVDQQGLWGPLLFMGMIVLQIVVAVIPGEPLEIVAGYAFGALEGTCWCGGSGPGPLRSSSPWISSSPSAFSRMSGGSPSGCFFSSSCRVRPRTCCAISWA